MTSHADSGFGSGLREQIQRRHSAAPRRAHLVAVDEQIGDANRRADDVLADDSFSADELNRASAGKTSRESQLAALKARLEQVGRDLADREARITDLQLLLEETCRQRDDTSQKLASLEAHAAKQRTRLMTARKQILLAAAASFAVALAIARSTRQHALST